MLVLGAAFTIFRASSADGRASGSASQHRMMSCCNPSGQRCCQSAGNSGLLPLSSSKAPAASARVVNQGGGGKEDGKGTFCDEWIRAKEHFKKDHPEAEQICFLVVTLAC